MTSGMKLRKSFTKGTQPTGAANGNALSAVAHFNEKAKYAILSPAATDVSADEAVRFIYVMRKDSHSVCDPIADKLAAEYRIPQEQVREVISPAYDRFVEGLAHTLGRHFLFKGDTEIHIFGQDVIDARRAPFIGERPAISLDPLIKEDGIETLGFSRGYLPGGTVGLGMMPRPGYGTLREQIVAVKDRISDPGGINIFEDDVYTGGSLTRVVDMLDTEGISVKRIIPGIQIGTPEALVKRGIIFNPGVRYDMKPGQDIDLGDPRDFLLGADGLVVLLDGKQQGRLPYVAPFVSPTARLSLPRAQEKEFSLGILHLNRQFFTEVEQGLAVTLEARHMNDTSTAALQKMMPECRTTRMAGIVDYIMENFEDVEASCALHRDRSAIKVMDLPGQIVFLDVNGTILPAESRDGHIGAQDLKDFRDAVAALEKTGVTVGLNSDSPLPQLREFAGKLGIPDAPILAENGAVMSYKGRDISLRSFDGLDEIKDGIKDLAARHGLIQAADVVAPEFGGVEPPAGTWAFGANRTSSLAVFAQGDFLKDAKKLVENSHAAGKVSCDFSPEHGFFGVHPGADFRQGKAETLGKLAREGHVVVSVGDSLSDYAPLANRVVFVREGLPSEVLRRPNVSVSVAKGLHGVIETLRGFARNGIEPGTRPVTAAPSNGL